MIIVKVFTDWHTSKAMINHYIKIYNLENDPDYNVKYKFSDGNDYTHAIICNKAMPNLQIPPENVIGLAYEPPEFLQLNHKFINYANKHISKYYIGTIKHILPVCFIENNCYLTHLKIPDNIPPKKNNISLIISHKQMSLLHRYRHVLAEAILKMNLPIDIYGNGCNYLQNKYPDKTQIKGRFNDYEPYLDYKFHICIENFIENHYFSEKIINPLLCETTPIYLGCVNIDTYFPNNIVKLTGKLFNDIQLLTDICNNPNSYLKDINKNEIYNKCSIKNVINEFL